jgi:hypothetical protein
MLPTLIVLPGDLTPTLSLPTDAPLGVHRDRMRVTTRSAANDDYWMMTG